LVTQARAWKHGTEPSPESRKYEGFAFVREALHSCRPLDIKIWQ